MASPTPAEHIASRVAQSSGELKTAFESIQSLHEKKLWHQLTEQVKLVVANPAIPNKQKLYTDFLHHFEAKLNPVSLVQILITIVQSELSSAPADALAFLQPLLVPVDGKPTVVTAEVEAHVLSLSHVSILQMKVGDNAASKLSVESAREIVDDSYEMDATVHSAFYRAAAEYHKVVGTASDFFRNALQFLAYTPPESLSIELQHQWAFDIGIAALVGDNIYNFGEVLSHSIIKSLADTEHQWLLQLLEAFNGGNLEKFDAICKESSVQMNAQPVLVAHEEFLKQKITILALMELAFSRSLEHSISFKDVQTACRLPPKEVEYLLMRSMSLGLISGIIDNVAECLSITRVQPRVLGREPIGHMAQRLEKWCANVDSTVNFVDNKSVGISE